MKFEEHFKSYFENDCKRAAGLIRDAAVLLHLEPDSAMHDTFRAAAHDMKEVADHLRKFREWCDRPQQEETPSV